MRTPVCKGKVRLHHYIEFVKHLVNVPAATQICASSFRDDPFYYTSIIYVF